MTEINNVPADELEGNEIATNFTNLKSLCMNNSEFFAHDKTENGQRLYLSFLAIIDNIPHMKSKVEKIRNIMHTFDFDQNVQGNGYRSYITITSLALKYAIDFNLKVQQRRESLLFRKTSMTKDVEAVSHLLASLDSCLKHLETILSWTKDDQLFPEGDHLLEELVLLAEETNQYCFYGRNLGFQYSEPLKNILKFISLTMAIFSEAYYSQGSFISKATNSVLTTTKYISDPELRAKRVVNIATNASVDFCKAFWALSESELMNQVPSFVLSSVAVSKIIHLPAEPLFFEVDDMQIEIPAPSSHIGKKPVQVRLISNSVHEGMIGEAKNAGVAKPASSGLLIHCHGGGFVAQSSKSHECYLRDWAKHLKVPILSIDYSLAPEAPFPRALEEVTYAYCWALKNHSFLGSTGKKIVAVGDSAGANLLVTASLKSISMGLPPPSGLFLAYAPIIVNSVPSPSRMLCLMDPLIPFGFLVRCLKAYVIPDPERIQNNDSVFDNNFDSGSFEEVTESDLQELEAHKSPTSEISDTLTDGSLCSNLNDLNYLDNDINSCDIEKSERYVSDFLEKYILDSDAAIETTKFKSAPHESTSSTQTFDYSIHNRISSFVSSLKSRFNSIIGNQQQTATDVDIDNTIISDCHMKLIDDVKFTAPIDPYLNPLIANDELLRKLPPTKILTTEFDPFLDDCVTFSKKLKSLNKDVTLDVLKSLPHGFLNFSLVSKEAYEGSMLCVKRIKELLDIN